MREEWEEAKRDPLAEYQDDEDDYTSFEICLINKNNSGLILDVTVRQGDLRINNLRHVAQQALNYAQLTPVERRRSQPGYSGPDWRFLSEPLQSSLTEYLYAVGLRPEIALAVEYLSWNAEQRLYLNWLKRSYKYFVDK